MAYVFSSIEVKEDDNRLSQLALSSLWIKETNEIFESDDRAYLIPKQTHFGRHSSSSTEKSADCQQDQPVTSGATGVPGFPDFPSIWRGEEGYRRRTHCINNGPKEATAYEAKANRKDGRRIIGIRRQAVNTSGMIARIKKKGKAQKKQASTIRRVSATKHRRYRLLKHNGDKQSMAAVRRGLASISFS